ncbi:oligosaccharide flippase family protein [Deinococcus radiopugnans]|uniref:oligosaccharide flippase family protein n=1 Tax=Deinococcus radiopugnans TaxID=57497 RepID=UPI00146FEE79|nr:oligosaccharide flippase family protein [Deinococcus radiopugnans]
MRRILQASAIMGLSSVVTVGLSALRYKLLALELGPEGIGLLGLFVTTLALGVTLFGMGVGSSGIRQVAASQSDDDGFGAATRAALLRGSWLLGLLAAVAGLLLFPVLRASLFTDAPALFLVGLVVAIAASVVSAGQVGLLNGLGRLPEIAKANSIGAVIGTALTLGLLPAAPQWALAAAFVATPLAVLALTTGYTYQLRAKRTFTWAELWSAFRPMLFFGLAFSVSLLMSNLVQILLRILVNRKLDLENVGYFQAAWTIASVYLGFVITSMAAEYYPRISAIAHDALEVNRQVNAQVRLMLFIATPIIFLLVFLSPVIVAAMYAPEFGRATELLRWQLLGDIVKVASWPVGFLLLAREAKRAFFLSELIWNVSFLLLALVLIGPLGLKGLGLAYGCAYMLYFAAVLLFSAHLTGFKIDRHVWGFIFSALALSLWARSLSTGRGADNLWGWKILIVGLSVAIGVILLIQRKDTPFSTKRL